MPNRIINELIDLRDDIEMHIGSKSWGIWFGKLEKAESAGPEACQKLREEIDALIEEKGPGPYELIKIYLPDGEGS